MSPLIVAFAATVWLSGTASAALNGCGLRGEECCTADTFSALDENGCDEGLACINDVCVCGAAGEPCCPFEITMRPPPLSTCEAGFICETVRTGHRRRAVGCVSVDSLSAPAMSPIAMLGSIAVLLSVGGAWDRRRRRGAVA